MRLSTLNEVVLLELRCEEEAVILYDFHSQLFYKKIYIQSILIIVVVEFLCQGVY